LVGSVRPSMNTISENEDDLSNKNKDSIDEDE